MKRTLKSHRGASAVEFAIVLPLLVLLVFGIIEFSLALYDKAVITNASREGARKGIVARWDYSTNPAVYAPVSATEIQTVVNTYLSSHLITFSGFTPVSFDPPVTPCPPTGTHQTSAGSEVRVTVVYPYTFLVMPNFITSITGPVKIEAETRMRCE